jgi:hypothetical protein
MANRYGVVARTYLRWPLASALVVLLLPVCLAVAGVQNDVSEMLAYSYLTLSIFGWSLGTHVKEQFANSRASLLPGFRGPHLAMAAALAVPVIALATATICYVQGTALLGTAAVVLALFTAALWWAYWPTWTWLGPALLTLPLAFPLPRSIFTALVEGDAVLVSVLLLLVCIWLLAMLVHRLWRLDEELPEYHVPLLTRLAGPRQADVRRTWSTWGPPEGQPDLFPRRVPVPRAGSFWGRVRLWRFGITDSYRGGALLAMGGPLGVLACYLLVGGAPLTTDAVMDFLILFGLISSAGAPVRLVQRWPRLGYELLRPTARRDFYRQMGLAFACDMLEPCLWLLLLAGVVTAIWSPAWPRIWEVTVFLALLVCMWVGQWALVAWAVSYTRSLFLLIPAVMGLSFVPYVLWKRYQISTLPLATEYYLLLALGMMLLWTAVLYLAYRRWQGLDLQ